MRKGTIKAAVLAAVFIGAVLIFGRFMNDTNEDLTTEMKEATLPVITMYQGDQELNELHGYVTEMDAAYMRDTITPVGEDRKLPIVIQTNQTAVDTISYEIRSLDATRLIANADVTSYEERSGKITADLQIQNLLENMIYSLVTGKGENNRINQTTMGLIFLYLVDSVQYVEMRVPNQYENMISMTTLDYIEQKYKTATLTELCELLHLPMHVLSKMIKKTTGFNFKDLLQRKRLNKSVELMCDTDLAISDIIAAVGYENNSYFHRVFKERYHMTPRAFREKNRQQIQVRL